MRNIKNKGKIIFRKMKEKGLINKLPSDGIIWLEALGNIKYEQNPEFAQNYIRGFEKCGEFIKNFILK